MGSGRSLALCLLGMGLLLAAGTVSSAAPWPSSLSYSVGLSSDDSARIQMSASAEGMFAEKWGAKIGGWWVTGGTDNRAFVGDAYVNYTGSSLYAAAGRKYLPFGPAGVLVSPGIAGGEVQYHTARVTVQAIGGRLAFAPVTGGTRFTFGGSRAPADESIRAARVAVELTDPKSDQHTIVGGNWLSLLDDTGVSGDISADVNSWLTVFGETARFGEESAYAYGIRFSNQKSCPDPGKYTMATIYGRNLPIGYVPAAVGAVNYFEDQTGLALGVYHQMNPNYGVGVFADRNDVIVSLFGYVPLH